MLWVHDCDSETDELKLTLLNCAIEPPVSEIINIQATENVITPMIKSTDSTTTSAKINNNNSAVSDKSKAKLSNINIIVISGVVSCFLLLLFIIFMIIVVIMCIVMVRRKKKSAYVNKIATTEMNRYPNQAQIFHSKDYHSLLRQLSAKLCSLGNPASENDYLSNDVVPNDAQASALVHDNPQDVRIEMIVLACCDSSHMYKYHIK